MKHNYVFVFIWRLYMVLKDVPGIKFSSGTLPWFCTDQLGQATTIFPRVSIVSDKNWPEGSTYEMWETEGKQQPFHLEAHFGSRCQETAKKGWQVLSGCLCFPSPNSTSSYSSRLPTSCPQAPSQMLVFNSQRESHCSPNSAALNSSRTGTVFPPGSRPGVTSKNYSLNWYKLKELSSEGF